MLTINLEWDSNALAAPQSFRDGIQQAAGILEAAVYDPITVNIGVGYGEYDNGSELLTSYSLGGVADSIQVSYSALRAALASNATSAGDAAAIDDLPAAVSLNGQTDFYISGGQAKALGALSPTDPAVDGYIGFPASFTGATLVQAGIDEIVHAMGMLTGDFPLALVEYTSQGNHYLSENPSSTPAYFSLDGGVSDLANYDTNFDPTLFKDLPDDPLAVPATGVTTLTSLDRSEIAAVGFDTSATPVLPVPQVTPSATAAGSDNVVDTVSQTVAADAAIPALSMITGASEGAGTPIVNYGFDDRGGGSGGYFEIGGVAEPDNQWLYVLDTQLSALQYVGGSAPGSQQIDVDAFSYPETTGSQVTTLIADTTTSLLPTEVFWTDPATGDTGYWTFDTGGAFAGFRDLAEGSTSYSAVGTGDFAGNGQTDVLWEDAASGDTGFWTLDGSGNVAGFDDLGSANTAYSVVGVGDFDAGGHDEVLWEDAANGDTGYWTTSGGRVTGFNNFGNANTSYSVVGTGDFDASGHDEVLWENAATGDTGYWTTNTSGQLTGFNNYGNANTAYSVVGIGDFDASGHDEVVWEDKATGDVGYWTTNAQGQVTGFHDFGFADTAYNAVGVGDYDGAGRDTLLWENPTTGDAGYWRLGTAAQVTGFQDFGDVASAAYRLVSAAA